MPMLDTLPAAAIAAEHISDDIESWDSCSNSDCESWDEVEVSSTSSFEVLTDPGELHADLHDAAPASAALHNNKKKKKAAAATRQAEQEKLHQLMFGIPLQQQPLGGKGRKGKARVDAAAAAVRSHGARSMKNFKKL
eukprot:CAMPEP_0174302498 /NCGR_PEP_ID=MMETSP0809-20121228/59662_1 /TAXON_ID=73025 ORGANISM="Eutreptiella gymnastica-like, Strain CCMP1594" /NCGR_SAMPLE_ID=MMETSP0809 /ASSEMBLY_ACC=CAM_ASM_000658 /LENGTH=136 /DNA_ID=CAMNT_0015408413 /DNA_START=45 /DNA_END=455 /DNA_ORIENTATION=+